jgi:hypothetical protein
MKSDSESGPWDIPTPGRKPPPGPERTAWLDAHLLNQNRTELHALLDGINPALRTNLPVALERESISLSILQFLERVTASTARAATVIAMLRYLDRGFKRYCRQHNYKKIRLPLVQDLGLEDGLLDGYSLEASMLHREMVRIWMERIPNLLTANATPSVPEVIGTVITSAALFGGLATARQWKLLINRLESPVETDGQHLWFNFGENSSCIRWIADPVTETLIRRLTKLGSLPFVAGTKGTPTLRTELTPYIPRARSNEAAHPQNAIGVLERATKGMLIRHFAPDVASIALEELDSTSLPHQAWLRVITGRLPIRGSAPTISVQPRAYKGSTTRTADNAIWGFIDKLKNAVAWDPGKKRDVGIEKPGTAKLIRDDYVDKVQNEVAGIRRDIQQHYLAAGEDGNACYPLALCDFIEDLIKSGGPVKEKLAPATIASYFGDAIKSLAELAVPDLRQVINRQDIYFKAIGGARDGNHGGVAISVQLFERTLLSHFDLDEEVDWSLLPAPLRLNLGVDANLVDEATYRVLWEALKVVRCEQEEYRTLWRTLSLLLYRFGLRRGEAHELTLADIHMLGNRRVRLRIPPSRLTTFKSRHAVREIGPVILPTEEWEVLDQFLASRKQESKYRSSLRDVYLCARPGHGSQLLDSGTLFDPITQLLRWITGDTSMRIHHFRHGFASRLFAAGRSPLATLDESLNRDDLWQECFTRDGAWVRAFEMGHVSPMESTSTYCHTSDLVRYFYSKRVVTKELPLRFLSTLAGLSERSLERTAHRQRSAASGNHESAADLLLETARQRWPLRGEATEGKRPGDIDLASMPAELILLNQDRVFAIEKKIRFRDVLDIIRGRLCNRLNITEWEQKGIASRRVRDWVDVIDKLTALGFLRANRRRRDRMPAELIACGERTLQSLGERFMPDQTKLLARCLVGFGSALEGIRVDPASAKALKEWLEFRNPDLRVETLPGSKGLNWVKLVGKAEITRSELKMFILVLAVYQLRAEDIDTLVSPYRRG